MNHGRNIIKAVVLIGIALGCVALDVAPVHAASSAWYSDPAGDAIGSARDLVGLRVEDDGVFVKLTAQFAGDDDPGIGWFSARDRYWSLEFSSATRKVEIGPFFGVTGDCPALANHAAAPGTVWVLTTRACVGGLSGGTPGFKAVLKWNWPAQVVDSVESPAPTAGVGYRMVTAAGDVHSFGGAANAGGVSTRPDASIVDIESVPGGDYLLLAGDGVVTRKGNNPRQDRLEMRPGERATSISANPTGSGYLVFTDKGRVAAVDQAKFFGDMRSVALNGPILDSVMTPSGNGYYMVASDGGVFAFGDARFHGSMGGIRLNQPVQSLVPDPDRTGYWLVASDGGVFAFEAAFRGSMGAVLLNKPVTSMVPNGNGYLMVGEDGGIFNFSDQPFHGSLGSMPPSSPVVAVAAGR